MVILLHVRKDKKCASIITSHGPESRETSMSRYRREIQIYGNVSMLSNKSRKVNIQVDVHPPARIKGIENNM